MDVAMLEDLFPLMRRATRLYTRVATRGHDGLLHLPYTESPEYAFLFFYQL